MDSVYQNKEVTRWVHTDSEHKKEQMGQILSVTDQLLLEHEEA